MKLIILCLCLAVANCLDTTNYEWEWSQYKNNFNKHYSGETDFQRFAIFKENLKKINDHNDRFLNGAESYLMRMTIFTDMTPKEVKSHMGFKFVPEMAKRFNRTGSAHWHMVKGAALPASVDWRTKGVVTAVKNQESCGSCWAFSTTGALEGQHALATGKLVSLSEQNLVDCTQQQGNFGCEGGWPFDAYEYIIRFSQGIDTEASYPYVGIDETCKYNPDTVGATETAFAILPPNNELALQDAVANVGPISVCIDADFNFQSYSGGVFDDAQCSSSFDDIDHCVLAVGYGHDTASGKDYWLVKNSWGSSWGENGYIKMVRNKMNQCAISTLASYPDVKSTF